MKTYTLKLLAGIALAGAIHKRGALVDDVDERTTKNLLQRGKARVATTEDLKAAGREVPAADEGDDADANAGAAATNTPATGAAKGGKAGGKK